MIIPIVPSRVEKKRRIPPTFHQASGGIELGRRDGLHFAGRNYIVGFAWICILLVVAFFFTVQCAMKNYNGIALRRSLVQGKTTPFFPKKKMDVSTIQVQEHGGKINQT
jgi:hypothetical protein